MIKQLNKRLRVAMEKRFGDKFRIEVLMAPRKSSPYHVFTRVKVMDMHGKPQLIGWDALEIAIINDATQLEQLADVAFRELQTEPERLPDADDKAIIH